MHFLLLLFSFFFSAFILCCYFTWRSIPTQNDTKEIGVQKLSVIIAARNEEKNILSCLEALSKQDYPSSLTEFILMDDQSQDGTCSLIQEFIASHRTMDIHLYNLSAGQGGSKKDAITFAISKVKNDIILMTDADCLMPYTWISSMINFFTKSNAHFVAGPVSIENENNIFSKVQSLEFMGLVGIAACGIQWRLPIMCNGANLMFSKKAFLDLGGFESTKKLASGDDTQLLIKMSKHKPESVFFLKDRKAIVNTRGSLDMNEFVQQRKRWAGKIPFALSAFTISIAVLSWLTHAFLLWALVEGVYKTQLDTYFVISLFPVLVSELLLLNSMSEFFKKRSLLWLFLPIQIFYWIYIVLIGAIAPLGKFNWKGRITR